MVGSSKNKDNDVDEMLIGFDGGATKFAAYEIVRNISGCLSLGTRKAEVNLMEWSAPVPLEVQLQERDGPRIADHEFLVGEGRVFDAASVIAKVAKDENKEQKSVLLGVCMPGIKTRDQRGICVQRNGPRMPKFSDQLQAALRIIYRIELLRPITCLISDGVACGLGELFAENGKFRDIEQGYYIGGGTGVAEAIVLRGTVMSLDETRKLRAWEIRNAQGFLYEDLISMKGMNTRFQQLQGGALSRLDDLEHAAINKNAAAITVFDETARAIVELVKMREHTFSQRWSPLQRVVLGQHTGRLFNDARLCDVFRKPLLKAANDSLGCEVVASELRAAPAIGAASTVSFR